MNIPKYSIQRCTKNTQRWLVSFHISEPFTMSIIKEILEESHYQVLATSPNIYVFKSKDFKITMHSYGLIQVDVYKSEIPDIQDIEFLIKEIFAKTNK